MTSPALNQPVLSAQGRALWRAINTLRLIKLRAGVEQPRNLDRAMLDLDCIRAEAGLALADIETLVPEANT